MEASLLAGTAPSQEVETPVNGTTFRAQLRGRGPLLELSIAGDGSCDIRQAINLVSALLPQYCRQYRGRWLARRRLQRCGMPVCEQDNPAHGSVAPGPCIR